MVTSPGFVPRTIQLCKAQVAPGRPGSLCSEQSKPGRGTLRIHLHPTLRADPPSLSCCVLAPHSEVMLVERTDAPPAKVHAPLRGWLKVRMTLQGLPAEFSISPHLRSPLLSHVYSRKITRNPPACGSHPLCAPRELTARFHESDHHRR